MARKLESHQYQRIKRYPSVLNPLKWAAATAMTAAAFHVGSDIVSSTGLHSTFMLGGIANFSTEWVPSQIERATTFLTEQAPVLGRYAHVLPDLAMHNQAADTASSFVSSHLPFTHNLVRSDDLVTAEGAGLASAILTGGSALKTLLTSSEVVDKPSDTHMREAAEVMGKLKGRRYKKLNQTEIAVEIAATSADIRKANIDKSAFWARTIAPITRLFMSPETAADITLKKEIYRRMPSGFLRSLWDINNSGPAELFKKIPGPGDAYDGFVETGDFVVGLLPKRDVFGNLHFGMENIGVNIAAFIAGSVLDFVPGLTSNDVKESVEIVGRPVLAAGYPDKNGRSKVDQASAVIIGSEAKKHPRRYSSR